MVRCAPMLSPATLANIFLMIFGFPLDFGLLIALIWRRIFSQLRFLALYGFFLGPREVVTVLFAYSLPLATSRTARHFDFYFYWATAFVLSFLRLGIIIEIFRRVVSGYRAIWGLAWRLLTITAVALSSWTVFSAARQIHAVQAFILTSQQLWDFSTAIIVLFVIGWCVYYQIQIPRLHWLVLVGSCLYSCVQVADSELGRYVSQPTNSLFDYIQRIAFSGMIIIWLWGIIRWSGEQTVQTAPAVPAEKYDRLSADVHDRLKELNDKLSDLLRRK
jgi:hypothetical protein